MRDPRECLKPGEALKQVRKDFLKGYEEPGEFTPREIGIPEGPGIILPSERLLQLETFFTGGSNPLEAECDPSTREIKRLLVYDPLKRTYILPFVRCPLDKISEGFGVTMPDQTTDINWTMVEGSFAIGGFGNMLFPARLALVFTAAEEYIKNNSGQPFWYMDQRQRYSALKTFAAQARIASQLTDINSSSFAQTIEQTTRIIAEMRKLNIQAGQEVMRNHPQAMTFIGTYAFALLKSGQDRQVFRTDEELKNFALSLAKAECAPNEVDYFFPNYQSAFSSHLNHVLDLTTRRLAKRSFAFGNRALLEALNMERTHYMGRMRITRNNVNLRGLDLNNLTRVIDTYEGRGMTVTVAPKSVFTALGEAMSEHKVHLDRVLKEKDIEIDGEPKPQLAQDFDYLVAFDKLLAIWQNGEPSEDLDKVVFAIYDSLKRTPDIVRGSVFPPDMEMNNIVNEAMQRQEVDIYMILSYFDGQSQHPEVISFKDAEARKKLALKFGLPENVTALETVRNFYRNHEGEYPYGAVHLFGPIDVSHSLFIGISPAVKQRGEVRIIPKTCERLAYEARVVFKWNNSGHVVVG